MPAVQTSNGSHPTANGRRVRPGSARHHEQITDIQRRRILAAATHVTAEHGVANITVAQIVSRAGVSRRTFYELFTDREDCLLQAIEEAREQTLNQIRPAYEQDQGWREKIRAGLTVLLQVLDGDPDVGRLLVIESLGAGPRVLEIRARALSCMATALDAGRSEVSDGASPSSLTADGLVGAVSGLIHAHLLERSSKPLLSLVNPLMSMIVLPYLGPAASAAELEHGPPRKRATRKGGSNGNDPLRDLKIRLTYRTVTVLSAVATNPESSNRRIAQAAGIADQGQISKLLARLGQLGLIENTGARETRGEPNAWRLTPTGLEVEQTLGSTTGGAG